MDEEQIVESTSLPSAAGGIKRKPLSRDSVILSPTSNSNVAFSALDIERKPAQPSKLAFVLGHTGFHGWYDAIAVESEEASRDQHSRYWSCDNDARLREFEENPIKDARTLQLFACSPNMVTAGIFANASSPQQQFVKAPYQGLIQRFGKLKREHERSVHTEQDMTAWITGCLLNNIPATDLHIAFGPEEGYYAHAPNRSKHRGLPYDLHEMVTHSETPPDRVSLGIAGTWWVRWQDGKQEQYIQQNSYPDLCMLLENTKHPQLKSIQLNPARGNEFVVEYANGYFLIKARCSHQDLRRLNNYVREHATNVKVIVLTSILNALGKEIFCEPFVLPTYDFESSPIMLGKEIRAGQITEWLEQSKANGELTEKVKDVARASGACPAM